MRFLYSLVLVLSFIAFIFSIEKICKIEIFKKLLLDEDNDNDRGIIDYFKGMTPLGLGISASCIADYIYSAVSGALGRIKNPEVDTLMNTVIFVALEIITFIILFYLVYGVLSIFKSHGDNEKARRNVAGWTTVIVSFALIFFASQLGA